MRTLFRPAGIFALLYASTIGIAAALLPRLIGWHFARCTHDPQTPLSCSVSAWVLSYWWLALLPVLLATTALMNWVLFKRRAV